MSIRGGQFPQELWSLSSDDEEGKLVHLIQTVAPDSEYPLFPGVKEFSASTSIFSDQWAGRFEFHYFLALHTPRTFTCWKGTGLGDESCFVLLGDNEIQLYGDQAPSLYEELVSIYRRWEQLGKPRMLDYNLEFIPQPIASGQAQDPQSDAWVIDRKFFRQIVRL